MIGGSATVQSPAAYDRQHLTPAGMRTRIRDSGYRFAIHPAETAAGLVEGDLTFGFDPGDIRRYGAISDGATDCAAAIQSAVDQFAENGAAVRIPCGTWRVESAITGVRGLVMYGDGRYRSIIQVIGAINFYTFTGTVGNPDGGAQTFRDFTIQGSATSGNLVELTSAGQNVFDGMRFWKTGAAHIHLVTECHRTKITNCLFQSWTTDAIGCTGLNSIISISNCQFNILGGDLISQAVSSAAITFDSGEQHGVHLCNVNGDETLNHFIRVKTNSGRSIFSTNYVERVSAPCIQTDTGAELLNVTISESQLSCGNSMSIDLSAGNPAHTALVVRGIRRPETAAGTRIVNFGTGVVDYHYMGGNLDGSAGHVQGLETYRSVRKYSDGRIELNGNPVTAVTALAQYTFLQAAFTSMIALNGALTPTQLTGDVNNYSPTGFSTSNVLRLSSDASRNITGLDRDGNGLFKLLINVGSQNIVLLHQNAGSDANKRFVLPGSASVTVTPGLGVLLWYDTVSDRWRVIG